MANRKKKRSKVENFFAFLASILLIFAMISTVSTLLDYKSIGEGTSTKKPESEEINPSAPEDEVVDPLMTPYGRIPEEYAEDPDKYPILLFSLETEEVIWAGDRFGGEKSKATYNDDGSVKKHATEGGVLYQIYKNQSIGNMAVYFQKDHVDVPDENDAILPYYNFGMISGEHIIDLNGNNFTATNTVLFQREKKNNMSFASWTVKNGIIDLRDNFFISIQSSDYDDHSALSTYYHIENIEFINITSGFLIREFVESTGASVYSDILFRDCTFEIVEARERELFLLGCNSNKALINITVAGGSFEYACAESLPIFSGGGYDNNTLKFSEGKNGLPTMILPKTDIQSFDEVYDTSSGFSVWIQGESNIEDKSIFHLGSKNE